MSFNKIKILPYKQRVDIFEVYVDDTDISKYIKTVKIELNAGQLPDVWVKLVGSLEIPENIKAMVTVQKNDEIKVNRGELAPIENMP